MSIPTSSYIIKWCSRARYAFSFDVVCTQKKLETPIGDIRFDRGCSCIILLDYIYWLFSSLRAAVVEKQLGEDEMNYMVSGKT